MKIDDIKESDAVYPGVEIFSFFLKGSRCKIALMNFLVIDYKDFKGPATFEGLKPHNFGHWYYIFEKVMTELSESKIIQNH